MQAWIETNCTLFIDYVSGPLNPAETDFLYFTLATFRAAAGLPVGGFRRCVARETDGTPILDTTFGIMQVGDYRGTWNFEDLQKAFSALLWTRIEAYPDVSQKQLNWTWVYPSDLEAFCNAFEALPWLDGSNFIYEVRGNQGPYLFGTWFFSSTRTRSRGTLNFPNINRSIDTYLMTFGDPFLDYDGIGFVPNKFILCASYAETSESPIILDYLGNINTCPLRINSGNYIIQSQSYGKFSYLIKWNFTNA
jgi:hypothetical protein